MIQIEDDIIISHVLAGNHMAFSDLIQKYQQHVYLLSLKLLKNKEDAEDATQDSFVKSFTNLNKFQKKSSFSTWIYRITFNVCMDKLRSVNRQLQFETLNNHETDNNPEDFRIDEELDQKKTSSIILKSIERLEHEEKIIIHLYYFQALSIRDISEIIGVNENNLKVRIHRIRQKLYGMLKNNHFIIQSIKSI